MAFMDVVKYFCLVFYLNQIFTSSMTVPRIRVRMSTVGNPARLGGLYNYPHNQLLSKDHQFWNMRDIAELTTINMQHRSVFVQQMTNDIDDFMMNLELHSTEILDWQLNLIQPRGSMTVLKELYTPTERDITGYVVYLTARHLHPGITHRQINERFLVPRENNSGSYFDDGGSRATHVVTSVYTGVREFLACDSPVKNVGGKYLNLTASLRRLTFADLFEENDINWEQEIWNKNCVLYSDFRVRPTAVNASEALKGMKENFLLARNFSAPEVTDAMELTPLEFFNKNSSKPASTVRMNTMLIQNLSQSLLNLELALLRQIQPELEAVESRLFFADFTAYLDDCKKRIAFIVPRIRSGQLDPSILNVIIKSCRKSQFEANFMRRFANNRPNSGERNSTKNGNE